MARISRRSIDALRDKADIVSLAGDYTQLRQRGREWWGLSPFKTERTPSFKVNPETGLWYCFSTQQGGDIFKLVMARENLDFVESIERVATRFGHQLEYEDGAGAATKSIRGQLLDIHDLVADYWHRCLRDDPVHGEWIRNYWTEQRRFTLAVADDFQVGYAPVDDSRLIQGLLSKGFEPEALAEAGLFFGTDRSKDPTRWHCRFRGRLVIPIRDIQGRVIAFTARSLEITPQDDPTREAKYVNSPETELFKKNRTVFNLNRAKDNRPKDAAGKVGPFVLVEGQLDAIRCHSAGLPGVVAAQGTAVTEEHLGQLKRFSDQLLVFLDSDAAGQKAALRLLPLGLRAGLDIRFVDVPGGKDPDEFFANPDNLGLWPEMVRGARSAMQFCVQSLMPPDSAGQPLARRLALLSELFAVLEQCGAEEIVQEALTEAARHAGIGIREVHLAYERDRSTRKAARPSAQLQAAAPNLVPPPKSAGQLSSPEEELCRALLADERLVLMVAQLIPLEWVATDVAAGQLLAALLNEAVHGEFDSIRGALGRLDDACQATAAALSAEPFGVEVDESEKLRSINGVLRSFHARHIQASLRAIDARIASLPATDIEALNLLLREKIELRKLLNQPPQL
ncbi:MAG: DNA primase [Opitutales bacterium]